MSILSRLKFEFTINTLFIGILFLIIGSGVTSYWLTATNPYEAPTGSLPVPIQVGKNKVIVSKTGDASMQTEYRRRRAIIGSNGCGISPKFSHQGSTNGSLETYFLSSICPTFVKDTFKKFVINTFDGQNVDSEFTGVLDGNEPHEFIVDGGDADTNIFTM